MGFALRLYAKEIVKSALFSTLFCIIIIFECFNYFLVKMNFYNKEVRCIGCGLYFCCSKCRCIHEEAEHQIKRDTKTLITDFRQLCQEYGVEEVSILSKKRLIQQFETLYEEDESECTVKAAESPTTTEKTPIFSTPEQPIDCVTPEDSPQSDSEVKQKIIYTPHSNTAKLIYSPKGKFRINYREFVARKAIEKLEDASLDANESPPPNSKDGGVANPIKQVSTSTPSGSLLGEWAAFQEQVAEESISVIIGTLKENLQHNLTHEMSKSDISGNLSKLKGIIVNRNADMTNSFSKTTKKVKFAENTVFTPSKFNKFRVFRKPSRKLTPGPQKRYSNNPKFKALIEAFENKQIPSTTPVTCNPNFPARAIDFKDDSSKEIKSIDVNQSSTQNDLKTEHNKENTEVGETNNNDKDLKLEIEPFEIKLGVTPSKEICRATTTKDTSANKCSGPDNLEACVDELMSIIKLNVKQFIKNPEVAVTLDRKKKLRVIIEVVIDEVKDTTLKITNSPTVKSEPDNENDNNAMAIEECNTPVSRLTKSESLDSSGKRKYDILTSEDHDLEHCIGPSKYKKCNHNHRISGRPPIHPLRKIDDKKSTSY